MRDLLRMQRVYNGLGAGSPANINVNPFNLNLSLDEIWELVAIEFWQMQAMTSDSQTGGGALWVSLDPDDITDLMARASDHCVLYVYPESHQHTPAAGTQENHWDHGLFNYPSGLISAVNPVMGISVVDRAVEEIDASVLLMYRVFKPTSAELALAVARRR